MGCWKSTMRHEDSQVKYFIKHAIDISSTSLLKKVFRDHLEIDIDSAFISCNNLKMNPLGYALFQGKTSCFLLISSSFHGQVQKMERIFYKQGYRGIDIICIQGNLPMLEVYLPLHLARSANTSRCNSQIQDTICLESNPSLFLSETMVSTPIQYACIYSHLNIVKYLINYFEGIDPPSLFDLNYQEELFGENCPLISCRLGLYKLMKFLHEICNANFHVRNKRDENALLILAAASNKKENLDYYKCMKYLLEVVKVDPVFRYEDIVLVINDSNLLELYYSFLKPFQIYPNKKILEKKNEIKSYPYQDQDYSRKSEFKSSSQMSSIICEPEFTPLGTSFFNGLV